MASYRDYTSYVSTSSKANDYTPLVQYSDVGMQSVPSSSLMKMSLAPGGNKFFSTAPSFQSRLDSYRIAPPAMTPVNLTTEQPAPLAQTMTSVEGMKSSYGSDYASIYSEAYRMNPM